MRRKAGESILLSKLSREYTAEESFGKESGFPENRTDVQNSGVLLRERRRPRLWQRVLRWQEESRIRCGIRSAFAWFLRGSIGSFGVFLLVLGVTMLCVGWLSFGIEPASFRFIIPMILLLSSVPLLHSAESCSSGIRKGRILRGFLIGFCGLPEIGFGDREVGEEHRITPVAAGFLLGSLSLYLHPGVVVMILLVPPVFSLLFSAPELAPMILFSVFPFLNLAEHPSVLLVALLCVCDAVWIGKAVSGKRQFCFGVTDLAVLLLAALFAAGGVFGAGSAGTGLLQAFLLVSAWFPVRAISVSSVWHVRCRTGLLLSSLACAALGIWQYCSGRAELRWLDVGRFADVGGRVCSLFGNPNILAIFLLLTVPSALGMAVAAENRSGRLIGWLCFAAGSLCLVFTWSRGAWLGWIASAVLFLLLYSRRSLSVLFLLPVPLAALLPYLPHSIINRFGSIGSMTESSSAYRFSTWRGVLRMLRAHPWGIGCGEDAFHRIYPRYAVSGTETVMHAHQLFLQITAELGIPGLAVFLFILWRILRRFACYCKWEYTPGRRAVTVGTACALAAVLVMGMFDCIWYHNGLFWLFWAVCAMLTGLSEKETSSLLFKG